MPSASSRRAGSAAPRGRSNGSSSLRKSWATSGSAPHGSGWARAPCSRTSSVSSSTSAPADIRPRTGTPWYETGKGETGKVTTVSEIFETMAYGPAPESDKQARDWLAKHGAEFELFAGGSWVKPASGEWFDVINPATTQRIARVPQAGKADVDAAVAAARAAFPRRARLPRHPRARHLYALAREGQRHARLLAVLESMDNGKSIRETAGLDIPLVARHFYHHAGWAQLQESEFAGAH